MTESEYLRGYRDALDAMAVEIEANPLRRPEPPARIPEPEKWGVVYARLVNASIWESWLRHPGEGWHPIRGGVATRWDDLIDPVLIREGVES